MRRIARAACLVGILAVAALFGTATRSAAAEEPAETKIRNRTKVPGKLLLHLRTRPETKAGSGEFQEGAEEVEWEVAETAIIIIDMWDDHYCRSARQRVNAMAPRVNQMITAARSNGVQIFHAPSGTMESYQETDFRKRMMLAPPVEPPVPIESWCYLDTSKEGSLPIDDSDGGCDDPNPPPAVGNYKHQHPGIDIVGGDGMSDNGAEIYSFCRLEGIKNIAVLGVHTNMCVLGRPFGIRQLTRLGFNVVLVRDLTDAMYSTRSAPFVSHTRGTNLVIEHIEKYWCPSILSADLAGVIPGSADPQ